MNPSISHAPVIADTRSIIKVRRPFPWRQITLLAPAAVILSLVVVIPLIETIRRSLAGPRGWRNYPDVLGDPQVLTAVRNSALWLVVAVLVGLAGLGLSRLIHRRTTLLEAAIFAAPLTVAPIVAAVAFRLIFDPDPSRGVVSALLPVPLLGSGWIWAVLISAFAWQWLGVATILFRFPYAAVPRDLVRLARSLGATTVRRFRLITVPSLTPAVSVALLILIAAAVRIFELVRVATPGSVQDQVDVAALHWWRAHADLGSGGSAALAVLLFLVAGSVALVAVRGIGRDWPGHEHDHYSRLPPRAPARARARLVVGVLAIVWLIPFVALVLTSFRSPEAAVRGGWWNVWNGWSLESYALAFEDGTLASALITTTGRALFAALITVTVAVFAAHALAWGRIPPRMRGVITASLAVIAVIPPQVVMDPVRSFLDEREWLGIPVMLPLVHAGLAVPLAILLLRPALARLIVRGEMRGRQTLPGQPSAALYAARRAWLAVLAVGVLTFIMVWNDVVVALWLGGPGSGQITLLLMEQSRQFVTSIGVLTATAVVVVIIPLGLMLAGGWILLGRITKARVPRR